MKLISILQSGQPAEKLESLPPVAKEVCQSHAELYKKSGYTPPWTGYLAVENQLCVGTCAFKSAPHHGRVEIAYFTFPEHQGKGIATRMAQCLTQIACESLAGIIPFAQTLPEENASTSILKKLGFTLVGEVIHPEDGKVWQWELLQNGDFDLNLIEHTLALPYEERLLQHDGALTLVLELQKQGELLRSQEKNG